MIASLVHQCHLVKWLRKQNGLLPQDSYRRIMMTFSSSSSPPPPPPSNSNNKPIETIPICEEELKLSTSSAYDNYDNENNYSTAFANSLRAHYTAQTPVVIRQAVKDAKAIKSWASWEYLQSKISLNESANVEIGGVYSNPQVERPEIPFHDYIHYLQVFESQYGSKGPDDPWDISTNAPKLSDLVYMAQNDLFQPLYSDIILPSLCEDSKYNVGHGHLYSVMLWLGPRGCISPLHYDPLDNLLMQFVGRKRVILFAPSNTTTNNNGDVPWHYGGHDNQQYNTSPIDIENDPTKNNNNQQKIDYPEFYKHAPTPFECVLFPGDVLFIPATWWHHVRSLDTSASVNVWWR